MRHEQGGAHAAEGFARATGRPGVCLATSGPGATNLITGLADAMMDSTPVVALTAQVPTHLIGRDGFQEADIFGLTQPVTKHNWIVRDADDVVPTLRDAFRIAVSGRPGPVLVDVPRDFMQAEIEAPDDEPEPPHRKHRPDPAALRHAALAISNARRPILYVGGGVISSGASEEVRRLAKKARIPVTTTLMGKGAFPETDPQSLGMLGMHGTAYANHAMHECDLIIGVGVRFDDRVTLKLATWAPHARVVHVDIDESEIGKNRKADYPLAGDARTVLHALLPLVGAPDTTAWWARIEELKRAFPLRFRQGDGPILPQYAVDRLWRMTRDLRPILTTDVGQHQMWAAQYWKCDEPRTFITSGGLGTMGFGLPAAIGAQCADAGPARDQPQRRRELPADDAGADHGVGGAPPDQDRPPRQQEPRDGPPVAGALLREALLLRGPREPRLREARGGDGGERPSRRRARRSWTRLTRAPSPSRTAPPSSTSRSTRRRTATRCGRPGSRSTR